MIIKDFYIVVMNYLLASIKDTAQVSKIKHFDLWNNQTMVNQDEENQELPFPVPAVFMEYSEADFQTLGKRKQSAEVEFSLHVVSEVFAEHSSREDDSVRSGALSHLDLLDEIFFYLENHAGENFGSIVRTGFKADHNHGSVYEHILRFKVRLEDRAAMHPLTNRDPVTQNLITEFKKPGEE